MGIIKKYCSLLFFLNLPLFGVCQATIDYTNPSNAVNVLTSSSLNFLNPIFIGGAHQIGIVDASNTNLGFDQGIILATGNCQMAANSPGNSDDSSSDGFLLSGTDPDLEIISGTTIFDAAVLEFDFVANSTNAALTFVFASEEYNEYVCGSVNDAFGIFLSGPGINGGFSNNSINIANIPGTTTPVSINTVNNGNVGLAGNINDCAGNYPDWDQYTSFFVDNSALNANPQIIEYDGFTLPIEIPMNLICGETYHLKIAIGDGGDPVYDSAVFVLADGFVNSQTELITEDSIQICYGTSIELNAQTAGNVTWTPSIGLSDPGISNPIASPNNDTWYYASSNACGSNFIDSVFIDVDEIIETVNFISICEGESYTEGNSTYTNFGMYEDIYVAASGCDSVVTTLLSVNPIVETTNVVSICQGEVYVEGTSVYSQPGIYADTYQSSTGCDSIVNTILNYLAAPITNIDAEICFGDAYFVGVNAFNASGTYTILYDASNGCDSTVILNLNVLPEMALSFTAYMCEGEEFTHGGETYTQGGAYVQYLNTVNGCDSTIYITLIENPIQETLNEVEICDGATYQEGNSFYSTPGVYDDIYQSTTGCDSIVTTVLSLADFIIHTNYVTICEGEPYKEGISIYYDSGTYEDYYQNDQGCDSLVFTVLTTVPSTEIPMEIDICEGQSYSLGTNTYTTSGTYLNTFQSSIGCDSLVMLYLTVNDVFQSTSQVQLCEGESFQIGNSVYTESGIYQNILQSTMGCDSIIITELDFAPSYHFEHDLSICEGDSLAINGIYYSSAAEFSESLQTTTGCDSIIEYNLQFIESELPSLTGSFCEGESVVFDLSLLDNPLVNGFEQANEGVYSFTQAGEFHYSTNVDDCISQGLISIEQTPILESSVQSLEVCEGEEVLLEVSHAHLNYAWHNGSTDSLQPALNAGVYFVDYDYACGDLQDQFIVSSKQCNCDLFVPNAFTPDSDGLNETWSPIANCDLAFYELSIYDRWGELIFTVDDIELPFIGGSNNFYHQNGVYVYKLTYKFPGDSSNRVQKGHINLIR